LRFPSKKTTDEGIVIVLPIVQLRPLLMKISQKIELGIIFSLVLVNMALTILRTVYSVDRELEKYPDQNVLWYFLQTTISVIVCALPCYRGMLSRHRNGSTGRRERLRAESAEFAEIWERYLVSVGEHPPEAAGKDTLHMESMKVSAATSSNSVLQDMMA
jgi:hypothetical protein